VKASSPLGKAKEKVKERLAKISPTMKKLAVLTGVAGVGLAAAYAGGYRLFDEEGEGKKKKEEAPKDVAGKALFYGEKALNYAKAKPYHVGGVAAAIVTPFLLWKFLPAGVMNKVKGWLGRIPFIKDLNCVKNPAGKNRQAIDHNQKADAAQQLANRFDKNTGDLVLGDKVFIRCPAGCTNYLIKTKKDKPSTEKGKKSKDKGKKSKEKGKKSKEKGNEWTDEYEEVRLPTNLAAYEGQTIKFGKFVQKRTTCNFSFSGNFKLMACRTCRLKGVRVELKELNKDTRAEIKKLFEGFIDKKMGKKMESWDYLPGFIQNANYCHTCEGAGHLKQKRTKTGMFNGWGSKCKKCFGAGVPNIDETLMKKAVDKAYNKAKPARSSP